MVDLHNAEAESLAAVADSLRSEPALRRFLTDPAVTAEAKTGLVAEVFGSKIAPSALSQVQATVGQRWTHAGDLVDGVQHLAEVAAVKSAGDDGSTLADELFGLRNLVIGNHELRDALSDPVRSQADKEGLLDSLLGGKVSAATLTLAKFALGGSHGTFAQALADYRRLAVEVHGQGVATVTTATELSPEQVTRLTGALAKQYGRPVHANVVVDKSLVGGVKIEIGDDVIDGTIASRLEEAGRLVTR